MIVVVCGDTVIVFSIKLKVQLYGMLRTSDICGTAIHTSEDIVCGSAFTVVLPLLFPFLQTLKDKPDSKCIYEGLKSVALSPLCIVLRGLRKYNGDSRCWSIGSYLNKV